MLSLLDEVLNPADTPVQCSSVRRAAAGGRAKLKGQAVSSALEVSEECTLRGKERLYPTSPTIWVNIRYGQSCAGPKIRLQEDTSLIIWCEILQECHFVKVSVPF